MFIATKALRHQEAQMILFSYSLKKTILIKRWL